MKTPQFWYPSDDRPGPWARCLRPLSWLFEGATARRVARRGAQASVPVICVGNINAGGTGKTPTVIALIMLLKEMGVSPHVVSRGYGGQLKGPVAVDPQRHSASDVGDEPLLLAAFAPVWVARDRLAGVRRAQKAGAELIVMDDGFQNPSVIKDLSLIVVDAAKGFGNGQVIPAGPLREPVGAGLARGDLLLTIGAPTDQERFADRFALPPGLPRIRAALSPLPTGVDWSDTRAVAFAGIGHPEKFFDTLKQLGAEVVRAHALADHQALSPALMNRLLRDAAVHRATLVTTEKDAVRLPAAFRQQVLTLPVRLTFEDDIALRAALSRVLDHSPESSSITETSLS